MRISFPKLLLAGLTAMAFSGAAKAADFFDSTLTLQGMNLDLGEAGRTTDYAILTTVGGLTLNASTTGYSDGRGNFQGEGGNVGVNGGDINLNDGSLIQGNSTLRTGGNFKNGYLPAAYIGKKFQGPEFDTKLTNGANAANTFATKAAALSATLNYSASNGFFTNLTLNHSSLTITAKDSNPVVLKLANFTLDAGSFTLVGTAMTKFIIDVDQNLSLINGSSINLSGGLLAGNVVFNVVHGSATLSSSTASGILLATQTTANLTNSTLTGELVAQYVNLNAGSKVKKPVFPSP